MEGTCLKSLSKSQMLKAGVGSSVRIRLGVLSPHQCTSSLINLRAHRKVVKPLGDAPSLEDIGNWSITLVRSVTLLRL